MRACLDTVVKNPFNEFYNRLYATTHICCINFKSRYCNQIGGLYGMQHFIQWHA